MTTTSRTTRLAGFTLALLMTAVIHGAIVWQFDEASQQANGPAQIVVTQNHGAAAKG